MQVAMSKNKTCTGLAFLDSLCIMPARCLGIADQSENKCKKKCRKSRRGKRGFQGRQGFQGSQGFQGFGFQGNQGLFGFQGNQGFQSAVGFQGNQGLIGFQGVVGLQGFQGFGFQGRQGSTGPLVVQEQSYLFPIESIPNSNITYNFAPPVGVLSLIVEAWGSGGFGGASTQFGGGGAGYLRQTIAAEPLTINHTFTLASGAGQTTVTGNNTGFAIIATNGLHGFLGFNGVGGTSTSTFPAFDVDSNTSPSAQFLSIPGINGSASISFATGGSTLIISGDGGSSFSGAGGTGSRFNDSTTTLAQRGETPGGGAGAGVNELGGNALVIITY